MEIIVDASVLIAVVLNEPEKPSLIDRTRDSILISPSSTHWEIGNAFSTILKRKRMTLRQTQEAIRIYETIPIRFVDVDLKASMELADALRIYAYDAYLLLCAQNLNCPLLTLDLKLRRLARESKIELLEV